MTQTHRTFFDKSWADHAIADLGDDTWLLQIDRLFLHERSGSPSIRQLEASGRTPANPEQVFTVIDHVIDSRPGRGPDDSPAKAGASLIRTTRAGSAKYGFRSFDVGDPRQGIVHVVSPETGLALPGLTLVCGDSHTCTVGGVGTLGWGIGSTEGEHVLATQTLPQVKPGTMRVRFDGRMANGVSAKDLVLYLIGKLGANGGIGYAVEFAGAAIQAMPVEARLTLCNMAIEFSAKYGFVPPDDTTFDYLHGREFAPKDAAWDQAVAYWRQLRTDPEARFDREVAVDCTAIGPQVTWGTSPQQVTGVDGVVPDPDAIADASAREATRQALRYMGLAPGTAIDSITIDAAYIGSCTNARISDLRAAAAVLRGRKVAPGVKALCVPGSTPVKAQAEAEGLDEVFKAAGFEWHESACALCAHLGNDSFANLRVVSTTNRNFEGRQGPNTRTHLASPETVALSAVAGRIADNRKPLG
jgi:3-isopropylmalate/(R)-2-methylmalate dehydratase large subunit